MKIHIGIITARVSLRNLLQVDAEMRALCDITYLPYSDTVELINVYLEHASEFDGFLFSGKYPYDYITKNIGEIIKPATFLDLTERDIYLTFARLFASRPNLDISRVLFSTSVLETASIKNQKFLDDIFAPKKSPHIQGAVDQEFYNQNISVLYETALEEYRTLWYTGKYDLIVTRLTNASKELDKENIPYLLVQPCRATIMELFHKLLADIKDARMESAVTACCVIHIAHESSTDEERKLLKKVLAKFNSEQNMVFVLRQNGQLYEAVTSKATIKKITSEYTTCLLTSYLYEMLPFSTYIGWGMGYDIVTAQQNALRAIRESKADPHRYTYLVNESKEMIGPLCGDRTISYQLKPSARTNHFAKELGISAINLEKMISLQKNRQMTEFSASDLVFYLDITPRSATRILKKLSECGVARQVNSLNLNGRGRPAAIYEIDFDKL